MEIDLLLTLLGGFGANFALLWSMKNDIEENKREFAKCPYHNHTENIKND